MGCILFDYLMINLWCEDLCDMFAFANWHGMYLIFGINSWTTKFIHHLFHSFDYGLTSLELDWISTYNRGTHILIAMHCVCVIGDSTRVPINIHPSLIYISMEEGYISTSVWDWFFNSCLVYPAVLLAPPCLVTSWVVTDKYW